MSNSFKSVISSDSFYYKTLLTGFVIVFLYLFNQFSQNGRYIDSAGSLMDSRTGQKYSAEWGYRVDGKIRDNDYFFYMPKVFPPGLSFDEMEKIDRNNGRLTNKMTTIRITKDR